MSEYAGELIMREKKGILIVVSGFSGAGKGTLMKKLMQDYDNYALSISATTRQPRVGEEDGREYFFRTKEEFEKMIARDELIEYARYVENYYGTPKRIPEKGRCICQIGDLVRNPVDQTAEADGKQGIQWLFINWPFKIRSIHKNLLKYFRLTHLPM